MIYDTSDHSGHDLQLRDGKPYCLTCDEEIPDEMMEDISDFLDT